MLCITFCFFSLFLFLYFFTLFLFEFIYQSFSGPAVKPGVLYLNLSPIIKVLCKDFPLENNENENVFDGV